MAAWHSGVVGVGLSEQGCAASLRERWDEPIEQPKKELKRLLKSLFAKLGYQVQGTRYCPRHLLDPTCLRTIEFDDVICRRLFEVGQDLTFIQVGAFDGMTRDPLQKYIDKCGWRGVLVEPQSQAASKLRELYSVTTGFWFCRPRWIENRESVRFSR
jgi:hypothetical protein